MKIALNMFIHSLKSFIFTKGNLSKIDEKIFRHCIQVQVRPLDIIMRLQEEFRVEYYIDQLESKPWVYDAVIVVNRVLNYYLYSYKPNPTIVNHLVNEKQENEIEIIESFKDEKDYKKLLHVLQEKVQCLDSEEKCKPPVNYILPAPFS